jgi:hypothetical protein
VTNAAGRKKTRAERLSMPLARDVVKDLAVEHGACVRPVQLRRTDLATGQTEPVLVPCGHTLASVCPSCAERAKNLRAALDEWLTRIEHSIKPSMAQNWRNYANYYVKPYIGERDVLEIDGAVCDALYAKLLAEGRVKAKPQQTPTKQAVHVRRLSKNGKVQPCRPYRYDEYRCYRTHAEDDLLLGQPIESAKPVRQKAENADRKPINPGLEPKTVVNTHRMLHRAWADFDTWNWAKRNVVSDAHPPRVPRKGRKVWTVTQLQTFLQRSRQDRFFAL